ncbi:Nitrogen fixation protein AnfA (fragment) [Desulfamplus magnetovallimortis]|uniref:Nitrogen fixation protein AnfA n=1 Tax=Desulfamplus magnetovallimortis TaxID=1246637 RepID=A0A1W1HHT2_9BACT
MEQYSNTKYFTKGMESEIVIQDENQQNWDPVVFELLQTKNTHMQKVFNDVRAVASTRSTVLLTGETGTGKGVTARLIHRLSPRCREQFVQLHCGAIPDTLIESELFGHEKGSFTGAIRKKAGKFETARGGTIFLDEIGTITPSAQIKLLQVLQDNMFQRIGGEENIHTDVRIIAATNIDLKQMCEEKLFRKDLYYRLNVFPIELPSLKDRKEDIPYFMTLFLKKLNIFHMKGINSIHPDVVEAFVEYEWPGNIRELENLMERAYILEESSILMPDNFPPDIFAGRPIVSIETRASDTDTDLTLAEVRQKGVESIERVYLETLLAKYRGKINITAQAAGISTRQLHKLMSKYNLSKEGFKESAATEPRTAPYLQ